MKKKRLFLPNLTACIIMDLMGMASLVFPMLGEISDLVWAPVSALIFNQMFGGRMGMIGGVLNFMEEIIPVTDIIPSFTIAWFIRKKSMEKELKRA